MQGLHLTNDLFNCTCPESLLRDEAELRRSCIGLATDAGLTVVGDHFHTFADAGGVTGVVLLAESHLAVHTWPEFAAVTLDVYVCNFLEDNSHKAKALMDGLVALFAPATNKCNALQRGLPLSHVSVSGLTGAIPPPAVEWITPDVMHGFVTTRLPSQTRSPYQLIEWHDTRALGRVFALDGAFMASERDEFVYHECMVHVPALALDEPERALIMGGGDGGSARELLKHKSIKQIVVAELDDAVVDSARREFAAVVAGAFDNSRVSLHIGDALGYLRNCDARFDLVVMDLTDPGDENAAGLYSEATYRLIREHLSEQGIVSLHLGSAFYHPERFARTLRALRLVFPEVHAYKAFMPLYGAEWGMACASKRTNPTALSVVQIQRRLEARGISNLRFYSARSHHSLFAWPGYAEKLGA